MEGGPGKVGICVERVAPQEKEHSSYFCIIGTIGGCVGDCLRGMHRGYHEGRHGALWTFFLFVGFFWEELGWAMVIDG